jgi:hypothetical protein
MIITMHLLHQMRIDSSSIYYTVISYTFTEYVLCTDYCTQQLQCSNSCRIPHQIPYNTVTDHKNFLKKEMIAQRGKLPWIIWYKQMVEHGIHHGIYIPPFELLEKHTTLGGWWLHLPRKIQAKKKNVSGHIFSALLNKVAPANILHYLASCAIFILV